MATNSVVACNVCYGHVGSVLNKAELLAALKEKGVKNVQIEKALDLPSSRVSEILYATPGRQAPDGKKPRELTYDEGVTLVRAFGLEEGQAQSPTPPALPERVLRLVARHMADSLGLQLSEEALQDLSEDLRAFAVFVADPTVRKTLDMAEGFFRGMRLRRPAGPAEAPPGTDPHHAH